MGAGDVVAVTARQPVASKGERYGWPRCSARASSEALIRRDGVLAARGSIRTTDYLQRLLGDGYRSRSPPALLFRARPASTRKAC